MILAESISQESEDIFAKFFLDTFERVLMHIFSNFLQAKFNITCIVNWVWVTAALVSITKPLIINVTYQNILVSKQKVFVLVLENKPV